MHLKPRGIRNNNPGNIEKGAPWQGLASPDKMTAEQADEDRFAVFVEAKWGIRALMRLLMTYQAKHDLNCVTDMLARYAPASENHTDLYARFVAGRMGVGCDESFSVSEYELARRMVEAIIEFENGCQPYDRATIDSGLLLAGIELPSCVPWPGKSRTTTGTAVALVGTTLGAAAEPLREAAEQIQPLVGMSEHMKSLFLILTVAGLGLATYARIDAAKRGKTG